MKIIRYFLTEGDVTLLCFLDIPDPPPIGTRLIVKNFPGIWKIEDTNEEEVVDDLPVDILECGGIVRRLND